MIGSISVNSTSGLPIEKVFNSTVIYSLDGL
jgi:hypothetical protein